MKVIFYISMWITVGNINASLSAQSMCPRPAPAWTLWGHMATPRNRCDWPSPSSTPCRGSSRSSWSSSGITRKVCLFVCLLVCFSCLFVCLPSVYLCWLLLLLFIPLLIYYYYYYLFIIISTTILLVLLHTTITTTETTNANTCPLTLAVFDKKSGQRLSVCQHVQFIQSLQEKGELKDLVRWGGWESIVSG